MWFIIYGGIAAMFFPVTYLMQKRNIIRARHTDWDMIDAAFNSYLAFMTTLLWPAFIFIAPFLLWTDRNWK